jgi:hypothetical protein
MIRKEGISFTEKRMYSVLPGDDTLVLKYVAVLYKNKNTSIIKLSCVSCLILGKYVTELRHLMKIMLPVTSN